MVAICIYPTCGNKCDQCNSALTNEQLIQYAKRYAWLRGKDLGTIDSGGVFAGMTPRNVVLNGADLDSAIDSEINAQTHQVGLFDDLPEDSHFC